MRGRTPFDACKRRREEDDDEDEDDEDGKDDDEASGDAAVAAVEAEATWDEEASQERGARGGAANVDKMAKRAEEKAKRREEKAKRRQDREESYLRRMSGMNLDGQEVPSPPASVNDAESEDENERLKSGTVSYTHLTLPTILLV